MTLQYLFVVKVSQKPLFKHLDANNLLNNKQYQTSIQNLSNIYDGDFAKIVNVFELLTFLGKSSILDI